jgi:hypothetical protein
MAISVGMLDHFAKGNHRHPTNTVKIDSTFMLDPWATPLPPQLIDGTTGASDLYPLRWDMYGSPESHVAAYEGQGDTWVTSRMDSKYYYTIRNCFVPYGIVDSIGNVAYEIYWYTETAQGTKHAAFIKDIYKIAHAQHPDCPVGLSSGLGGEGKVWVAISVAPTPTELETIRPLLSKLQPVPAYSAPRRGHCVRALKALRRLGVSSEQHLSRAPAGRMPVVTIRANASELYNGVRKSNSAVYFEVYEIKQDMDPIIHLFVPK